MKGASSIFARVKSGNHYGIECLALDAFGDEIDMANFTIREIIERVNRGEIRVPTFQRGFVWTPEMVAHFMDSIYKGYPFGSLLFWRTRESLKSERRLGPFELPNRDPHYPIDYVLDGQQRVTSLFGVFERELPQLVDENWTQIYFDFRADPSIQESQFFPLADDEANADRHFPLHALFDTVAYRQATRALDDDTAKRIDEMQARFKEVQIPVQMIETENRASVAIIFERINRNGVPLNTLQLLSAWTWSEDFDLQEKFEELAIEIQDFGYAGDEFDATLLLRCCAAVIAQDAAPETLVNLDGALVRERFEEVANGVRGAIDFLKRNLHAQSIVNLPFTTMLVPLSVFFAIPGNAQVRMTNDQRQALMRWFWRTCFSRRYASGVLRNLKADIQEVGRLKAGTSYEFGAFKAVVPPDFFSSTDFRWGSVNTSTFILLLAQEQPISFISGNLISLQSVLKDYNRNEFHHVFPRKHLKKAGPYNHSDSVLANFAIISRSDNNSLGGVAPVEYQAKMPADNLDEILHRSFLPPNMFTMEYDEFVTERARMLVEKANELMA